MIFYLVCLPKQKKSTEKKFICTLDIYLGQCVKKLCISVLIVAENNERNSYVNKHKDL